jgi:hypothetical protein
MHPNDLMTIISEEWEVRKKKKKNKNPVESRIRDEVKK